RPEEHPLGARGPERDASALVRVPKPTLLARGCAPDTGGVSPRFVVGCRARGTGQPSAALELSMWRRQLPLVLLLLASPAVLVAQEPTGPSEPPPAEAPDEATPASDEETTRSPWWGSRAAEGAPVPSAEATVQALRALHWKNRLEVTLARQALARADRAA